MFEPEQWILDKETTWALDPLPFQRKVDRQYRLNFVAGGIVFWRGRRKGETQLDVPRVFWNLQGK